MVEEKLPHEDVLSELLGEKNNPLGAGTTPGKVNDALHERATRGNNPAGELQSPNEGLQVL